MSLPRLVALVFGAVFVLVGILGFIPGITTQESPVQGMQVADGAILGLVPINAFANIFHIVVGAVLLFASRDHAQAVLAARVLGVAYLLLGVLGVIAPEGFNLLPLGGVEMVVHFLTAAVLLLVGFMSPADDRDRVGAA